MTPVAGPIRSARQLTADALGDVPPVMTSPELAAAAHVTPDAIVKAVNYGLLTPWRNLGRGPGRGYRFRADDPTVAAYLQKHRDAA